MNDAESAKAGSSDRPCAFERVEGDEAGGLLLLCDHASNAVPECYHGLGLPRAELERHIGYDVGAAPLTRALAARLKAPALLTCVSRLVIDPNRGEDDPTLIMRLSDGAVVPGNAGVDAGERERRLALYYRPYHAEIAATLDRMAASGRPAAILSVHSYTPVWRGVPRPWHAGVLWDRDPRMARPLINALRAGHGLRIGSNEPYVGALKNDTMYKHGTSRGLAHALLEVRNDLIETPAGVLEWADRLEPIVAGIVADDGLHRVRFYGSRADGDRTTEDEHDVEA
ncbi:N-formylglutamate amidohydrolase [Propylenella binzhouense]|uniref:N-formylglutamate amidohydrolase n=1 Tax=Propylenella binzhouense TaxID=2555902 RepID=A0A964T641_9HYPH|nr:N-formylglutamate amidohydrolase [Propylenella binzhouense]MYZ48509.1 N-formylglutamate amidohydrolase [Propylenella binzhouense]